MKHFKKNAFLLKIILFRKKKKGFAASFALVGSDSLKVVEIVLKISKKAMQNVIDIMRVNVISYMVLYVC